MASRQKVFEMIYRFDRWHGPESRSGPGSTRGSTERLSRILPELVEGLGISSILDAGAGDSLWMPELPGYVGVDVVPEAVVKAQDAFGDRRYLLADLVDDELPPVDAVFVRDVLAHLSNEEALGALENLRRTGARWIFATTFDPADNSTDTRTGRYREYDITRPPYALGEPWWLVEDGFWEDHVEFPNKYLGLWTW